MIMRLNDYRIVCIAPNRWVIQEAWLIPSYVPVYKFIFTIYQEVTTVSWLPLTFEGEFTMYFTNQAAAADYMRELRAKNPKRHE